MQSKMGFKIGKCETPQWEAHILQRPQTDSILYEM